MRAFSSAVFCGRKTNKLLKVLRQGVGGNLLLGKGKSESGVAEEAL